MDNFRDGHFGHKPKGANELLLAQDRQREGYYPRGSTVDSDTSDELSIIRHDTNEFDQETSEGMTSTSSQGDVDVKEDKPSVVHDLEAERFIPPVRRVNNVILN